MASNVTPFRDVLAYAIGGGWGQAEPTTSETKKVCVIRGTDIPGARLGEVSGIPVRYESESKAQKRVLQAGDIVLEVSGGNTAKGQYTGRTLLIDQSLLDALEAPAIPASFCRLVRVNPEKVDPTFAYYWLQEMYASSRVALYENQSVGISNFQFERFLDAEAKVLPSLREQRVIADTFASLDQRISNLRATNETLEAIVQTLFKSWFVDFDPVKAKVAGKEPAGMDAETAALFPSEFEESELGLIPKGWQLGTLGDLLVLRSERLKASAETAALPYVPIDAIPARTMTLGDSKPGAEAQSSLVSFKRGDILFGAMRPYFHKVCVAPFDGVTRTTVFVLEPKHLNAASYALLQAFQDSTVKYATDHSEGTTMPYAKWTGSLDSMPIVLSTLRLQEAFHTAVSNLVGAANSNAMEMRSLVQLRDLLLPKLISGELRLPGFADD